MKATERQNTLRGKLDLPAMIIPLVAVVTLCLLFIISPERSNAFVDTVRGFLGNQLGFFYIVLGFGLCVASVGIAISKIGSIRLGNVEKPLYSDFKWGSMIFTGTMAADIMYYSFIEWAFYAAEPHVIESGDVQLWASTYPLFHWGPIPWSIYLVLAVAFGFMLHIRGRDKQKFSEACRPIFKDKVDKLPGKIIDLIAIFALISGTATTFSLATPLITECVCELFSIPQSVGLTIVILLVIAAVYTIAVVTGMKGIVKVAAICVYLFFVLMIYYFFGGGESVYILETTVTAIGNLTQNFIGMSTWMDPLRESGGFVQNWTIFYWAYWLTWCVATPFFIGTISKGRTVREVIFKGYGWGLSATFLSFSVFGNYGLAKQMKGDLDVVGAIANGASYPSVIVKIFETLPFPAIVMILVIVTMIAFYATTFDSLTMVVSSYSYKKLSAEEEPHKTIRTFWAAMFIIFPIGLIFAESSLASLQSVSIIMALPIGIVVLLILLSFIKDARSYLAEKATAKEIKSQ